MHKLVRRVFRRLCYEHRKLQHKLHSYYGYCQALAPWQAGPYDLDEPVRAFPGAPRWLPHVSVSVASLWRASSCVDKAAEVQDHRLAVLSDKTYELSDKSETPSPTLRALAAELPKAVVDAYTPIAWSTDFRAGYSWPKNLLFFDACLSSRIGADIKIPWELSRFVHVGQLAHCEPEVGGNEFLMQVLDWISENPRFKGINWSSELVVAIRAINWIWGLQLFRPVVNRYPRIKQIIAGSIYDHYLYLRRNLAYHESYSDDHYLGDLVGIIYITAAFPEFPDADRWLLFSILGLESEMKRQVLEDGYSHMMSSHYHRFVAELFVSGAALLERLPSCRRERLNRTKPADAWPYVQYRQGRRFENSGRLLSEEFYEKLTKMGIITAALTKPNGLVPQLGDNDSARVHRFFDSVTADVRDHSHLVQTIALLTSADLGERGQSKAADCMEAKLIASELYPRQMENQFPPRFSDSVLQFAHSGIAAIRRGPFHVTFTCSRNGYADGNGGHGHNDKLSFELNVNGVDFIVDGGCPYYTSHPELRNDFRSARAHNTMIVAGMDQDPIPGNLFALPQRCSISLERDGDWGIVGFHTGYGSPHTRRVEVFADHIIIEDSLSVDAEKYLCFNLDPAVSAIIEKRKEGDSIKVKLLGGRNVTLAMAISGVTDVEECEGFFGVGYGRPVENKMLRFRATANVSSRISMCDSD